MWNGSVRNECCEMSACGVNAGEKSGCEIGA